MSSRSMSRKSGREKLENPPDGLPKVISVPPEWEKRMGGRRVLVPTPLMVDWCGKLARADLSPWGSSESDWQENSGPIQRAP